MKFHELKPPHGSRRPRKRIGRGNASGHGTYSGKGVKGQKARQGAKTPPWFEGGQMPLQRRVPKRGFNRAAFRIENQIVNLAQLARFEKEERFTVERMAELGLVDPDGGPIKVLARGQLGRAVSIEADAFSAAAKDAIEAAGGTVKLRSEGR
jgi:large subunit ribosomal protein L15